MRLRKLTTILPKRNALKHTLIILAGSEEDVYMYYSAASDRVVHPSFLGILADRELDFDAAIIAAFSDPGIGAMREMMAIPVVGLTEASILMACPRKCGTGYECRLSKELLRV